MEDQARQEELARFLTTQEPRPTTMLAIAEELTMQRQRLNRLEQQQVRTLPRLDERLEALERTTLRTDPSQAV